MQINTKKHKFFYWTPRVLAIVFICFLAIFALDVFIPGKTLGYYLVALFMHLIPNFALALVLAIAWKRQNLGGILFILAFIAFLLFFGGRGVPWIQTLLFSPLLLIGALFLIGEPKDKK
ncbi:MAG: hypothetical protein WD992_01675 [Candidatus Levyibacteriota bacterium]